MTKLPSQHQFIVDLLRGPLDVRRQHQYDAYTDILPAKLGIGKYL